MDTSLHVEDSPRLGHRGSFKILAFDTSSASGSVALMDGERLLCEWNSGDAGKHSNWLMPAIDGVLKSVGVRLADIDLYAVDTGPGSFTGLRIGVSTVKGLAWATGRKVVGVSTLEALALNLRYSRMAVCPVLDARKGEVYAAVYRYAGNGMEAVMKDSALSPAALFERLNGVKGPVVFLGNGLTVYSEEIKKNVDGAVAAPAALWSMRASNIAMLALERALRAVSPAGLGPLYLRKSEAEIKGGL
ncbi:MAG: tRNA (adenosine(37)-N6)-threonylcarbamoyltransferase complex dimerization subunit type 1 TsaB [Deltaproteobacteria bacterium]|nr:tRNA (adenosine(37)-N6)-threonylcarbamoyltransferase complex dimerization subunit type 1 TsaB [Deltaproteobacteria bacterium]